MPEAHGIALTHKAVKWLKQGQRAAVSQLRLTQSSVPHNAGAVLSSGTGMWREPSLTVPSAQNAH
jgi:hypothetical protein